jgi:hypothetical protein
MVATVMEHVMSATINQDSALALMNSFVATVIFRLMIISNKIVDLFNSKY